MSDESVRLALRIHDEVISAIPRFLFILLTVIKCNGSDVFGSDICTCRPYLIFGIEEAVKEAQKGGSGVVIYFRKEGRALGEVTKVRHHIDYGVIQSKVAKVCTIHPTTTKCSFSAVPHALDIQPSTRSVSLATLYLTWSNSILCTMRESAERTAPRNISSGLRTLLVLRICAFKL